MSDMFAQRKKWHTQDVVARELVPRTPTEAQRFGKTYLRALREFLAGKPDATACAYRFALKQFFQLFDWKTPEQITVAEAAYFKRWLQDDNKSDATVCLRLVACQGYFDLLVSKALIGSNPFRLVTRKDCTPSPYDRSKPTERSLFEALMKAIPDDAAGKRDKAVLTFFAATGCRRTEVAHLKVKDLDLNGAEKTYRVRLQRYPLPDACYTAILDHWLSSNRLKTLTPDSAVFGPVRTHHHHGAVLDLHRTLSADPVTDILKSNVKRAGLDPKMFRLHGLRHMFERDENGPRIQLGRATIQKTAIYIGKLEGPPSSVEKQLGEIRAEAARVAAAAVE